MHKIYRWGTDAQKMEYLPDLISGRKVGSLAMSEPGSGSDVVSMKLRADKVQGGWKLTGNKFWSVLFLLQGVSLLIVLRVGLRMVQLRLLWSFTLRPLHQQVPKE